MTTTWNDILPSTTSWSEVSPDTVHYKTDKLGQLYAGFKGGLVAGALTIAGVAFYSGYLGTAHGATSWSATSLSTTQWTNISPSATSWTDVEA